MIFVKLNKVLAVFAEKSLSNVTIRKILIQLYELLEFKDSMIST